MIRTLPLAIFFVYRQSRWVLAATVASLALVFSADRVVALPAFAPPQPGGAIELHRFRASSVFDNPMPIRLTRNNMLATGVRLTTNELDDYVLTHAPGGTVVQTTVPDRDRLLSMVASNWGVAIGVDQNGGTPSVIYAAPFGKPLAEIFRGTMNGSQSEPAISDLGVVAFGSRATNSHGLRDLNVWRPGTTASTLPDMGEDDLGDFVFIDGTERFITTQRFANGSPNSGLWRYGAASGWENLTEDVMTRVEELAGLTAKASNLAGDVVFPTRSATNAYLHLYVAGSGTIVQVADFTRTLPNMSISHRRSDVRLADSGELLAVIGGTDWQDSAVDVIFRKPNGDAIDLTALLPDGESLAAYPYRPQITMSYLGKVLIESRNDATGTWSYHYYDYKSGAFYSPQSLSDFDEPLQFPNVSDDGHVYYWRSEGNDAVLFTVQVPEAESAFLTILGAVAVSCLWRRCLA